MKGKRRFKARKTNPHFSLRCKAPDQAPQPLPLGLQLGRSQTADVHRKAACPLRAEALAKKVSIFLKCLPSKS